MSFYRWRVFGTRSLFLFAVAAMLLGGRADAESVAVTIEDSTTSDLLGNPPFTLGWTFQVNHDIKVTQLGVFDSAQDGLIDSYPIGVWDIFGNLLVSTTVANGTTDPLINQWRYRPVTPTSLGAGGFYTIGALYLTGNDNVFFPGTPLTNFDTAPAISFLAATFADGGSLSNPTSTSDLNPGYFGPNFVFIPEPSTGVLVVMALAALCGRRRAAR